MLERSILENEARRYGISVSSAEVDSEYQKIATENGGVEEIKKILSELYNMDEGNFKRLIKSQMVKEKLKEELPVKIHAYHILVKVPENADQKTIDDARNKIAGYLKEINEKKVTFEDEAKKYSEDEATKDKGGDLDWFEKGTHDADFDKAAFALRKGEISEPIKTKFGWHIIYVTDRKGKVEQSFNDWYDQLMKKTKLWKLII
jgi:parvulin-like peptidyl-prolyl isomerase